MEQYISKDAIVAEIERCIELLTNEKSQEGVSQIDKLSLGGRIAELQEVKVFLDALKVKEVDLDDTINEAKDEAMRDIAWEVHVMISGGKSISEIDHYVCQICDF